MTKKVGIILVVLSFAATYMFWISAAPVYSISAGRQYSEMFASVALAAFAWVNFISTRHKAVDKLFNGVDKSYIYHKYLSIFAIFMVVVHKLTLNIGKNEGFVGGVTQRRHSSLGDWGSASMYIFFGLIMIALLAKKLNYERWKLIHKLMIVPYCIGLVHYYGSSDYPVFSGGPFSIYMNVVNAAGLLSVIYSIFFYEKTAFKYKFKVTGVRVVAKCMAEITGTSVGKSVAFKAGQFAFMKFQGEKIKFPSHPFTISQAPKKGEIQFTIKNLGDDTGNLVDKVRVGDEFSVTGAHGVFNYKKGRKNQIWIAGGVGITPFRSFYQTDIPKEYSVDFFYSFLNENDGAYVEELKNLPQKDNFRVHLINSGERGFLTAEEIAQKISIKKGEPIEVYFCGPAAMRESLRKQFKNTGLKIAKFHFEAFKFK